MKLTVAESRYGLGLPLKKRPAASYLTYSKVSILFSVFCILFNPVRLHSIVELELTKRQIDQLCRTALLPSWHRRVQGFALPELSTINIGNIKAWLPNFDLDCYCCIYVGSYRRCS